MGKKLNERFPFKVHSEGYRTVEGFLPGDPRLTRTIEYAALPFDLRQVQRALFKSTYKRPVALLFPKELIHHPKETIATDIEMAVELVQAVYMGPGRGRELLSVNGHDVPSWYLQGMARFTGPTGEPETAPMLAFLEMEQDRSLEFAHVQVLVDQDRLRIPQ
jgi:hypothetical protein